jgi:hypothetical protein
MYCPVRPGHPAGGLSRLGRRNQACKLLVSQRPAIVTPIQLEQFEVACLQPQPANLPIIGHFVRLSVPRV